MEQKTQQHDEIVIDLGELFALVLRKIWLIIAVGLVVALGAYLLSKYAITPKYQSTTKVYVMNKQNEGAGITYSDLQSSTQLTKDYMTLVTSRPVIEQVNAELGLDMKYKQMVDMISVKNPDNTRILSITVEYTDPFMAKKIADAIHIASADHIKSVMDIDQVNVVEEANIPEEQSSPNTLKNTILGGFIGVVITTIIICLIFILDDTIKTPDDVEKHLGLSVLSTIPVQTEIDDSGNIRNRKSKKNKR